MNDWKFKIKRTSNNGNKIMILENKINVPTTRALDARKIDISKDKYNEKRF